MSFIWDAHSCVPLHPKVDLGVLRRHLAGGVSFVSINVGMDMNPVSQIMSVIASFRRQIQQSDFMILANNTADVRLAQQLGKLAVAFDLEGAVPLLEEPDMVQLYWDLGVRQIHLAYNRNNSVAGGCHDEQQGLTDLGRRIVAKVNEVGMLMDVSHTGYRSSMDIFACSTKPVIYSHANAKSLVDHRRNITDEQIRRCAASGGVICVNGVERFLGAYSVDAFLQHLAYMADIVGPSQVGIGLDTFSKQAGINDDPPNFDRHFWWPKQDYATAIGQLGYLQPEVFPEIAEGLTKMGFSTTEQAGILGENMLRVAKQCWEVNTLGNPDG